jgi:hypothetical protein
MEHAAVGSAPRRWSVQSLLSITASVLRHAALTNPAAEGYCLRTSPCEEVACHVASWRLECLPITVTSSMHMQYEVLQGVPGAIMESSYSMKGLEQSKLRVALSRRILKVLTVVIGSCHNNHLRN